MSEFGIKVTVRFGATRKNLVQTMRNVTEIHYGYEPHFGPKRIAFESDIHYTGCTYDMADIEEFETELETEVPTGFYDDSFRKQ